MHNFLAKAEDKAIIHVTTRQFGKVKSLHFYSLKLSVISIESLIWVLKSLCIDEMCPNEKALQSRIKEAFAFKFSSNSYWDNVKEAIISFAAEFPKNSYDFIAISGEQIKEVNNQYKHEGQLDYKYVLGVTYSLEKLVYEEIVEPPDSPSSFNVFVEKYKYEGVDQK